jgi:hypothetical protein
MENEEIERRKLAMIAAYPAGARQGACAQRSGRLAAATMLTGIGLPRIHNSGWR